MGICDARNGEVGDRNRKNTPFVGSQPSQKMYKISRFLERPYLKDIRYIYISDRGYTMLSASLDKKTQLCTSPTNVHTIHTHRKGNINNICLQN